MSKEHIPPTFHVQKNEEGTDLLFGSNLTPTEGWKMQQKPPQKPSGCLPMEDDGKDVEKQRIQDTQSAVGDMNTHEPVSNDNGIQTSPLPWYNFQKESVSSILSHPKPTSSCGTEPALDIPTADKSKMSKEMKSVCSPRTQALTLLQESNVQSTNYQQPVLVGVVNTSPTQMQKDLQPLRLPLNPSLAVPAVVKPSPRSYADSSQNALPEKVNTPPPDVEPDQTLVRLPSSPPSPVHVDTQHNKLLSGREHLSGSSLTAAQKSPSTPREVITQIHERINDKDKLTNIRDKQAPSEIKQVLREGTSSMKPASDDNGTDHIEIFTRPADSSEKLVPASKPPDPSKSSKATNSPSHHSKTISQTKPLSASTVPIVDAVIEAPTRRMTRSSTRMTSSSVSKQTSTHSSGKNSGKRTLHNLDYAENSIEIGDVGYTFEKYFPNHGVFRGRVTEIHGE